MPGTSNDVTWHMPHSMTSLTSRDNKWRMRHDHDGTSPDMISYIMCHGMIWVLSPNVMWYMPRDITHIMRSDSACMTAVTSYDLCDLGNITWCHCVRDLAECEIARDLHLIAVSEWLSERVRGLLFSKMMPSSKWIVCSTNLIWINWFKLAANCCQLAAQLALRYCLSPPLSPSFSRGCSHGNIGEDFVFFVETFCRGSLVISVVVQYERKYHIMIRCGRHSKRKDSIPAEVDLRTIGSIAMLT